MENTDFSNQQIFEEYFPQYEFVDFQRISSAYKKVIFLNVGILAFIFFCIIGVAGYFLFTDEKTIFITVTAFLLLLILIIGCSNILGFRNRKYAIRERDIIFQKGLLKIDTLIIPFNRIQHTELQEGWYSRKLGLKSISIFTAGGEDSTMKIYGLPKDIAERISQLILQKIKKEEENNDFTENNLF